MKENLGIKIFDKLYVGFYREPGGRMPVGRMVNYVDNKTNQRIRDRIDEWSRYGTGGKTQLNGIIVDNTPMTGFRISRSQINAGWYQTPEFIRVEDPRGFEVDITVPNMIMLTNNNVLDNGEIMQECIWGRDNTINVLLPVNSVPYKEAMENTDRQTTHVHVSKLTLGDHVILKNGMKGRYMGKLTPITEHYETTHRAPIKYGSYGTYSNYNSFQEVTEEHRLKVEPTQHYIEQLIANENGTITRRYLGYSSPNVSRIEKSEPLTPVEINQRLMDAYETGFSHEGKSSYHTAFLVLGTPEFRNWKLKPIDKVDLERHINKVKPREASGYRVMSKYYGRVDSMPEILLSFDISRSFSQFGLTVDCEIATFKDTSFVLTCKTIEQKTMQVSDISFEQLEFEIHIASTNQTFNITV